MKNLIVYCAALAPAFLLGFLCPSMMRLVGVKDFSAPLKGPQKFFTVLIVLPWLLCVSGWAAVALVLFRSPSWHEPLIIGVLIGFEASIIMLFSGLLVRQILLPWGKKLLHRLAGYTTRMTASR